MKQIVQTREISMRTYDQGEHYILIEGRLTDQRYRPRNDEPPEDSKRVHDMVVRLRVRGPGMLIEKVEVEMPHHPREECPVVLPWTRSLEGLKITAGFTKKVKGLIGNSKGCAHLTSLVLAMGPAAVQGYWAAYGVEREKINLRDEAVRNVINTCYLWRKDGPLVRKLRGESES